MVDTPCTIHIEHVNFADKCRPLSLSNVAFLDRDRNQMPRTGSITNIGVSSPQGTRAVVRCSGVKLAFSLERVHPAASSWEALR